MRQMSLLAIWKVDQNAKKQDYGGVVKQTRKCTMRGANAFCNL